MNFSMDKSVLVASTKHIMWGAVVVLSLCHSTVLILGLFSCRNSHSFQGAMVIQWRRIHNLKWPPTIAYSNVH